MKPGAYISKKPLPGIDIISRGDYTNPVSEVFTLRDSEQTITKTKELYVIVNDIKISFFKIRILGSRLGIRIKLSFTGDNWYDELYYPYEINAFETMEQIKFYMGIFFDDFIDLYNPYDLTQIRDFKLELIYQ